MPIELADNVESCAVAHCIVLECIIFIAVTITGLIIVFQAWLLEIELNRKMILITNPSLVSINEY